MSTDFVINRLGFTKVQAQDGNPAAVLVFVHGLRGNPQTTWSKKRSSQTSVRKSKLDWFSRKSKSRTQNNNLPVNASGSTSAPLPPHATSASNGAGEPLTLPAPIPVPSSSSTTEPSPVPLRSSTTEFCWPIDGLPQKLSNVQILLYGYEADIIGPFQSKSQNTITAHGNNFLIALERELPENIPLIFVAHSLGGILVKDVLSLSKLHPQPKYQLIHRNTYRVVFMGTPHRGSDMAGLAIILANITKVAIQNPNKQLLRGLDSGSEVIDRIHTNFMQLLIKPDFAIHCFQEDRGVTWVPRLTDLIVDYQSSKTGSPHEICETIAANHMDMVAFSGPGDDNYRQVSDALVSFVEEITNSSPSIARQQHMDTKASKDTKASEFLVALSFFSACLPRFPYQDAEEADRMDMRELEWFFDGPEFKQWSNESGLLWLCGIPKSGKTALSFCLWDTLKKNRTFTSNEDIAIFFCSPGSFIEAPAESQAAQILGTIINQLLNSNRKRLELVVQQCPMPQLLRHPTPVSPSLSFLDELWNILLVSIMVVPTCPVTLIIDGIDELKQEEVRQHFCKNLLCLQIELTSKGIRGFKVFITSKPFNDIRKTFSGVLSVEKDKERQECLQTLHFDGLYARRDRVEQAHKNTGEWLRDDAGYSCWDSSPNSDLLLIQGKPGSGKSTLAKFILNSLKSKYNITEDHTGEIALKKKKVLIADFFYSFRGGKTTSNHKLMLQSLLYQLLKQDGRLFPLFRDTFRGCRSNGHQFSWELDDLRKIFASLGSFKACKKIYILVDAMDESDEQGRPDILQLLMQQCSQKSECTIKALIATRPLPAGEINDRLSYCHLVVLQEKNKKDIENVIISSIRAIMDTPNSPSIDFEFIKNYMIDNAHGVFLWVVLVARELKELVLEGCSRVDLEDCLKQLPTELEDMYRLIIRRLCGQPEHELKESKRKATKMKKAVKMLSWATFAKRPLGIEEFRDAIAVPSVLEPFSLDTDFLIRNRIDMTDRTDRTDRMNHYLRAYCGSLLEIREAVVQLLHQTARDFLLRQDKAAAPFDIDEERGDTEISSVCIRYLRLLSLWEGSQAIENWKQNDYDEFVRWLAKYSLLDYVVSSLPCHIKSLAAGSPVYEDLSLFLQILERDKTLFCLFESWTELLDEQKLRGGELNIKPRDFRINSLIAAAQSGYTNVVIALTQLHTDIDGIDEASGMFALYAAAENGYKHTLLVILGLGADTNAQGGYYGNALQAASNGGYGWIVKQLIERGADVNMQGGYYGNALQAASNGDHEKVVEMLLKNGANINAQSGHYGSALQAALNNGHEKIAKILIEAGARPGSTDRENQIPVLLAAED